MVVSGVGDIVPVKDEKNMFKDSRGDIPFVWPLIAIFVMFFLIRNRMRGENRSCIYLVVRS